MEPSIKSLIEHGKIITGLLHIGSNDGEEVPHYRNLGISYIALFEPLKKPYETSLQYQDSGFRLFRAFNVGLLDRNVKLDMNVTENDKASSILPVIDVEDWTQHEVFKDWNMGQWPVVGHEKAIFKRYDDIVRKTGLPSDYFNTIVMDVQGTEHLALEGFGDQLKHVDYILIELSKNPVYKGQLAGDEIALWLDHHDFEMVTPMAMHDNVMFVRRGK